MKKNQHKVDFPLCLVIKSNSTLEICLKPYIKCQKYLLDHSLLKPSWFPYCGCTTEAKVFGISLNVSVSEKKVKGNGIYTMVPTTPRSL